MSGPDVILLPRQEPTTKPSQIAELKPLAAAVTARVLEQMSEKPSQYEKIEIGVGNIKQPMFNARFGAETLDNAAISLAKGLNRGKAPSPNDIDSAKGTVVDLLHNVYEKSIVAVAAGKISPAEAMEVVKNFNDAYKAVTGKDLLKVDDLIKMMNGQKIIIEVNRDFAGTPVESAPAPRAMVEPTLVQDQEQKIIRQPK